jgi:type III secretory pathway component EscT
VTLALVAAFARAAPLCLLLTALSRGLLGASVAGSLGLSLALALAPAGAVSAGVEPTRGPIALALLLLRELACGSLVALALLLPLAAIVWAVRFSELVASPFGQRSGPLAALYGLATGFLCLSLGLQRSLVIGLHESILLAAPASRPLNPAAFGLGVVQLVSEAFALALALGLPLLLSVSLVELGFALLRRSLGTAAQGVLGPSLRWPLLVLLGLGCLMPAVSEVPLALRAGLRLMRELIPRVAS